MPDLQAGDKAPDFTALDEQGRKVTLSDYKGQKLVLYFYPKDDTPGCTTEACDFNDNLKKLNKLDVAVLGVSRDSAKKHLKFIEKYGLKFPLIADEEGDVCQKYDTWIQKSMYGKKYMGIERSTFLIDEKGKIITLWRKVKVEGHVDEIFDTLKKSTKKAA
ncbi:MAG: thioredoxin-dependent thiol peroxidase [Alphaproteobacteria bacterium]|nr:thioredoxin-dependent thiol peroxidase [Alphaproteobacteria bacterium]